MKPHPNHSPEREGPKNLKLVLQKISCWFDENDFI